MSIEPSQVTVRRSEMPPANMVRPRAESAPEGGFSSLLSAASEQEAAPPATEAAAAEPDADAQEAGTKPDEVARRRAAAQRNEKKGEKVERGDAALAPWMQQPATAHLAGAPDGVPDAAATAAHGVGRDGRGAGHALARGKAGAADAADDGAAADVATAEAAGAGTGTHDFSRAVTGAEVQADALSRAATKAGAVREPGPGGPGQHVAPEAKSADAQGTAGTVDTANTADTASARAHGLPAAGAQQDRADPASATSQTPRQLAALSASRAKAARERAEQAAPAISVSTAAPQQAATAAGDVPAYRQTLSLASNAGNTPVSADAAQTAALMTSALAGEGAQSRSGERDGKGGNAPDAQPQAPIGVGASLGGDTPETKTAAAGQPGADGTGTFQGEMSLEQASYWMSQGVKNASLTLDGFGTGSPVEIGIALAGNQAQVEFRSDQEQARQILGSDVPQLRELLNNEGLVLAGVSVGTSSASSHGGGNAPTPGEPTTRRIERARGGAAAAPTAAAQPGVRRQPDTPGRSVLDVFA